MRLAVAAKPFEVHGVAHFSAFERIRCVTRLVGSLEDAKPLAAEGPHLWHEGHAVELTILIESFEYFFLAPDFHPVSDVEPGLILTRRLHKTFNDVRDPRRHGLLASLPLDLGVGANASNLDSSLLYLPPTARRFRHAGTVSAAAAHRTLSRGPRGISIVERISSAPMCIFILTGGNLCSGPGA